MTRVDGRLLREPDEAPKGRSEILAKRGDALSVARRRLGHFAVRPLNLSGSRAIVMSLVITLTVWAPIEVVTAVPVTPRTTCAARYSITTPAPVRASLPGVSSTSFNLRKGTYNYNNLAEPARALP